MKRFFAIALCVVVGFIPVFATVQAAEASTPPPAPSVYIVGIAASPVSDTGYWLVSKQGVVYNHGTAWYGDLSQTHLNAPVVGIVATSNGLGYWLVTADGGVFAFGDAHFYGSLGNQRLNAPVVGMTADPYGGGYWLVGADGGIFAFGAPFNHNILQPCLDPNVPVVGIAPAIATIPGYVVVCQNGVYYTLESNKGGGPAPVTSSANSIVGISIDPVSGYSYYMVASTGEVIAVGSAVNYGNAVGEYASPIVGIAATSDGHGYYIVSQAGQVSEFGDA